MTRSAQPVISVDVDDDPGLQAEGPLVAAQHLDPGAPQPPQGRPQVAGGAVVAADRPQGTGDVPAFDASAAERDEREEPLAPLGHGEVVAVD